MHDSTFVTVKLHRALDGRERSRGGEEDDDDPVQNGSAKTALISLERSEAAWRVIAQATSREEAGSLADAARDLRRLTLEKFPRAMSRSEEHTSELQSHGTSSYAVFCLKK